MNSRELVTLGEIADLQWGDTSVTKKSYVLTGDQYPAYSASGQDGYLPYFDYDRIGVVLSAIGANAGKTWLATGKWSCIKNTIRFFSNDESVADTRYLFWATQGQGTFPLRGSAQPFISLGDARKVTIHLPPIEEQHAIAATLGALDDKIESNRRAIEVLQRLSAAAFTRWRNEAVTVVTSTFGAYADVYGGATPKTTVPDYWGGGLAWATPTDVTGLSAPYLSRTSRTITNEGLQSCTADMHPAGTIFMTSRATIGAFAINQIPAATNQGFIAVRPRQEVDRYFLFEEMRSRVDEFLDNANGSTFLEISRSRFKELPLEVPEPEAIALLDKQIGPLHRKAAQLALESDRLTALRDALLPELLSGRVRALTEARP